MTRLRATSKSTYVTGLSFDHDLDGEPRTDRQIFTLCRLY
jgi:hypothetical protein